MKLDLDNMAKYGPFKAALTHNALVFLNGEPIKHVTKLDTKAGTLTRIVTREEGTKRPLPEFLFDNNGEFVTETLTGNVGVRCMRTGKTWGYCGQGVQGTKC